MSYVEVNGVNLYMQQTGKGTPILFLHPPLLSSMNFIYQQEQLGNQFQVITFDLRGHGKSDAGQEAFTYSLIVEDIIKLLDYLQIDKTYIAGYSTGGAIALEALLTYPDRFLGGIMISTMTTATSYYLKNIIRLAVGMTNRITYPLLAKSISKSNADCRRTYQLLYKEALLGNLSRVREYYQYSIPYTCENKRLASIQHPMLLLYGDKDYWFQKNAEILHQALPNHQQHWIKGLKHQLPTKAAEQINKHIADYVQSKA